MRIISSLIIFSLSILIYPFEVDLRSIRSIGDDESDEYTFFLLMDAVLSDNKDIFVIDLKGYCISKYNWEGIFQKRVGQHGAGPKDFKTLNKIRFLNNRLFVLDKDNIRIASFGPDLEDFSYLNLRYFKRSSKQYHFLILNCEVLGQDRFLFSATGKDMEGNKLVISKGNEAEKIFHQYHPFDKSLIKENVMLSILIEPVIGIDQKSKRFIVTVKFPGNEIAFFIYDFNGNLIKKASIFQDKNFVFPLKLFDRSRVGNGSGSNEAYDFTAIESIHSYGDYFIVFGLDFLGVKEIGSQASNKGRTTYFYMLLDKNGSLLSKSPMKQPLHVYYISPEGYVLAKSADDEVEVEKLLIYKLEMKGANK